MPIQNPDSADPNQFGRWFYGPWFWPPATPTYGAVPNPYYDPLCDPNSTWCEPSTIPGTPFLERHGSVPRYAYRERDRISDDHTGTQGLPVPDPQRRQRPVLQSAVVRSRRQRHGSRAERRRSDGRSERSGRRDSARRHRRQSRRGRRLDPDRHGGRIPPGARRGPEPGDHLRHRSGPVRRRQRGSARAAARFRRARGCRRGLFGVCGHDADSLQRRASGIPCAGPAV